MWTTLLRLGLWIFILVLVLYVLASSYPTEPWSELIPMPMLQQALVLSGILIVTALALRILDKGASAVRRNRCRVCRAAVPTGAIYCRAHLRTLLDQEDEKRHAARVRGR